MTQVCWVVKREDGRYLTGDGQWSHRQRSAFRFDHIVDDEKEYKTPREWAAGTARNWCRSLPLGNSAYVVRLVPPLCVETRSVPPITIAEDQK